MATEKDVNRAAADLERALSDLASAVSSEVKRPAPEPEPPVSTAPVVVNTMTPHRDASNRIDYVDMLMSDGSVYRKVAIRDADKRIVRVEIGRLSP